MPRGRKPKPTAIRRLEGNPGKRGFNPHEPQPPNDLPDCPDHLTDVARAEWDRVADVLHRMGVLTVIDRATLAAYCQCYARWVEAERMIQTTPALLKTRSGAIQQSPWMSIANKQLELMGRYMTELGMTPAARSRIAVAQDRAPGDAVLRSEPEISGPEGRSSEREADEFTRRILELAQKTSPIARH